MLCYVTKLSGEGGRQKRGRGEARKTEARERKGKMGIERGNKQSERGRAPCALICYPLY